MKKFKHLSKQSLAIFASIWTAILGSISDENSARAMELPNQATNSIYNDQSLIIEGIAVGALRSEVAISEIQLDDDMTAALYSAVQNADKLSAPIINIDHSGRASIDFGSLSSILTKDGATKTSA